MPPAVKRFSVEDSIRQKPSRNGACELPYSLSIGMAIAGGGTAVATVVIAMIYFTATIFFMVGQWVPVESAPDHLTVYKVRGFDPSAHFGVLIAAAGILVIAAGMIHFAALGVELLFEHDRVIDWKSIGLWAIFAAAAIGLGGNCSYTTPTSNSLVLDHPARTLTIDKTFLIRDDVHDVIPFNDVTGVRYRAEKSSPGGSYEVDIPEGWVYITVRGKKEQEIAGGVRRWLVDLAEDISAATGASLSREK